MYYSSSPTLAASSDDCSIERRPNIGCFQPRTAEELARAAMPKRPRGRPRKVRRDDESQSQQQAQFNAVASTGPAATSHCSFDCSRPFWLDAFQIDGMHSKEKKIIHAPNVHAPPLSPPDWVASTLFIIPNTIYLQTQTGNLQNSLPSARCLFCFVS